MELDQGIIEELNGLIEKALREDVGDGDLTSELIMPEPKFASATLKSREAGILAGIEVAEKVFRTVDENLKIESFLSDGDAFDADADIMKFEGNGGSILLAERIALNFLGRLSGIATLTKAFVDAVEGTGALILDTRKTTPTLRALEKYAVRAGGGTNHRMGLYDHVLIKENHIRLAGGLSDAVRKVFAGIGKEHELIDVVVEASNLEEAKAAGVRGVNRILLDNMTPDEIREVRKEIPTTWALEASGGINLSNVAEYASAGAEFISVGALTHSAKSISFTLLVD